MNIFWGRILIAGFAFEISAILLLGVVNAMWLQYPLTHVEVSFGLFVGALLAALWVNKKASSNQIINGTLVGVSTVLVYLLITVTATLTVGYQIDYDVDYFVKHIVKILGGALGGLIPLYLSKKQATTEVKTQ